MPLINGDYHSTTDSEISMSQLNEAEFDRPPLPFSAYVWEQPSTLPAIPWDPKPPPRRKSPAISRKRDPPHGTSIFPVTTPREAYLDLKRHERLTIERDRTRNRGQPMNSDPTRSPAQIESAPPDVAQPRRSPRIAALNVTKAEQLPAMELSGENRVAKKYQKPSRHRRQKTTSLGRSPVWCRQERITKRPAKPRRHAATIASLISVDAKRQPRRRSRDDNVSDRSVSSRLRRRRPGRRGKD